MKVPSTDILGIPVSAITMQDALAALGEWVDRGERQYVCVANTHSLVSCWDDSALRHIFHRAGLVTPDGMPLVWLSWLYGRSHVRRVYGPDLLLAACARSLRTGWRHFFYGGGSGVAEALARRLQDRFPGLAVAGTHAPPFRPLTKDEDEAIVQDINDAAPDIVWVGLGMPKQERWMYAHRSTLTAPVLVGVGAAFDFHAGVKPQAPSWMQQAGLEWLFRLLDEPHRLGPRYLKNNPRFVGLALLQLLGLLPDVREELNGEPDNIEKG